MGNDVPSVAACDSAAVLRLVRSASGASLSMRQLQYWDRTGLLSPSVRHGRAKRLYSFEDVLRLRIIMRLVEARLSTQRIRSAIENIRRSSAGGGESWHRLRIMSDGQSVFVFDGDRAIDAVRNQVVSVVLLGELARETRRVFARVAGRRQAA